MKMRATKVEQERLTVEAVIGFAAWLTSCSPSIVVGSDTECYGINERTTEFLKIKGLSHVKPWPEG